MNDATRIDAPWPADHAEQGSRITVWFWIIKILCTTVGESFADWINVGLGVGLNITAIIFTVVSRPWRRFS